ncbi:MAG: VanZ family protein [Phycisphaerae bacterium]
MVSHTTPVLREKPLHSDPATRKIPWLEAITCLYVLFIVYGSLLPFDFRFDAPQTDHPLFLTIPVTGIGMPDAVSNVALYLPLGLLLTATMRRRRVAGVLAIAAALFLAAGLSMTIECLQKLCITRTSSLADVACNIIGAIIGILVYLPESQLAKRFVTALDRDLSRGPFAVIAGGWAVIIAVTALVPFDLTFDFSLFADAVRSAHFVPFEKHNELLQSVTQAHGLQFVGDNDTALVNLWQLRIDYAADLVTFGLLGALIVFHLRTAGRSRIRAPSASAGYPLKAVFKASAATTALAILLTGAGLFVVSVGFDATRILTRALGGLAGAWLSAYSAGPLFAHQAHDPHQRAQRLRRILKAGLVVTAVYIAARELVPFRFDPQGAVQRRAATEWLPLHGYYLAKLPQAALDALHKSIRFIALGGLMTSFWLAGGKLVNRRRCTIAALAVAAAVSLLEFVQFWLPGRYPATTDVIIAGAMTTVGLLAGKIVYQWHTATTLARTAQGTTGPATNAVIFNVELPPPTESTPSQPVKPRHAKRRMKNPQP